MMKSRCALAFASDEKHPKWMCKRTNEPCKFIPPSSPACKELYGGGDGLSDKERETSYGTNDVESNSPRRGRRSKRAV